MERNPQTLQLLSQSFMDTLSLQPELHCHVEKSLSDADTPNYGVALLRLVAEPSIDEQIRQCAAVNFKKHIENRWVPSSSSTPIPHGEKEEIRTLIVPLLLSAIPKIQAQISEAFGVIGKHGELFVDEILQQIVIPNVMLRDEDEELFETNYVNFIKRDMEEGSGDLDTRRRIACELLKCIKNKEKISAQIHHCLALFAENPIANWKYKECAIYLVLSLATTDLVDVKSFFRTVIVPELQQKEVNAFPMLKAAALKFFFTMLGALIPKHVALPFFRDVAKYLRSNVTVVQSYAAIWFEKLILLVKEDNKNDIGVHSQASYISLDISSLSLVPYLFRALERQHNLGENEHVMRCIMRILQLADIDPELNNRTFSWDLKWFGAVAKRNLKNPVFTNFLFEALAALLRRVACEKYRYLYAFESQLVPELEELMNTELFPYALQLFAQLVELDSPASHYMSVFDNFLLEPRFWKESENVPFLVLLFVSLLRKAPDEVNRKDEGRLRRVVGIINELVSSPTTEEEGFYILNTVIQYYGYDVIGEYMDNIFPSLFARLHPQNSETTPTPRLVRCLIVFMSLFLVKRGTPTLVDWINNSVQDVANLFHVILGEFWIPNLKTISGYLEVKLCAVASTKLLYESALLLDPAAEELWGKLLDAIVTLLILPQEENVVKDDDDDDDFYFDFGGYEPGSKFIRLPNDGGRKEVDDPLKEIQDPKKFLVGFPANMSSEFSGRFPLVIMQFLSPPNQAALVKLCNSYNIAVV